MITLSITFQILAKQSGLSEWKTLMKLGDFQKSSGIDLKQVLYTTFHSLRSRTQCPGTAR